MFSYEKSKPTTVDPEEALVQKRLESFTLDAYGQYGIDFAVVLDDNQTGVKTVGLNEKRKIHVYQEENKPQHQ